MSDENRSQHAGSFQYQDSRPQCTATYLLPAVLQILQEESQLEVQGKRLFEIGCGSGATAFTLSQLGYEVTGIDPSSSGIELANRNYPDLKLFPGSAYDDLAASYGVFPAVISLDVIEHCFYPRQFAKAFYELLAADGLGIISTPFHGYWKNLAISLLGKWDSHLSPLWDHGHIKFFSKKTLTAILQEAGFLEVRFVRAGGLPGFAKSMVAIVRK